VSVVDELKIPVKFIGVVRENERMRGGEGGGAGARRSGRALAREKRGKSGDRAGTERGQGEMRAREQGKEESLEDERSGGVFDH
jgi:hypothetical protein